MLSIRYSFDKMLCVGVEYHANV